MIETADELSPEELAYQRSDVMTWRGHELQPFSYLRKTAAMAFMRYTSMPEPVIVIWLGLQSDKKVKQARSEPESVEDEIDQWADREKVLHGVTPEPEIQAVYDRIMTDIAASMSRPLDRNDAEKKRLGTEQASQPIT